MTKKVLVLIDWYEPGYRAGGPIRSIVNLCNQLDDHSFFILTGNTDHSHSEPYALATCTWHKHTKNTQVMYLSETDSIESALEDVLNTISPSVVYINSLFSKKFALTPLAWFRKNVPDQAIVIAPRGMLKRGALSVKPLKKQAFLKVSKVLGWFKKVTWHATNEAERNEIFLNYGNKSNVLVAPNLCALPSTCATIHKSSGELKLIMVSRVSKEKGVLEGIRFLQAIDTYKGTTLDIYGPMQDPDYLARCRFEAKKLEHITVHFHGEIEPHNLHALWNQKHFLYSTTLGENYGHGIVEAFLHQRPVLISDRTPWRNIEEKNAGYDLPLHPDSFAEALTKALQMDDMEYQLLVKGATALGAQIAHDQSALQATRQLFLH